MWLGILSLVMGAIPAITREIANAKVELNKTQTERERVAAEERIKALEARRDVLVAEAGSPWNTIGRMSITLPVAFYLGWVIAWDKIACKWFLPIRECTTDPLSDWLSMIALTVVGFYFVTDLTKVIKR